MKEYDPELTARVKKYALEQGAALVFPPAAPSMERANPMARFPAGTAPLRRD